MRTTSPGAASRTSGRAVFELVGFVQTGFVWDDLSTMVPIPTVAYVVLAAIVTAMAAARRGPLRRGSLDGSVSSNEACSDLRSPSPESPSS